MVCAGLRFRGTVRSHSRRYQCAGDVALPAVRQISSSSEAHRVIDPRARAAFWRLPYRARRITYRILRPSLYRHLQLMRRKHATQGYSFLPFIQHRCIFIHIPRCAGVSVSRSLFRSLSAGHTPIWKYQIVFDKDEFESFFKFTFVRNPWDRLLSAYTFLQGGGFTPEDRAWANANLRRYHTFDCFVRDWVKHANLDRQVHFSPQYRLVCEPGSTIPATDFIGRYETLEADYRHVAAHLGITSGLLHTNSSGSRSRDYREAYTSTTRDIVSEVYADDLEIFGYRF